MFNLTELMFASFIALISTFLLTFPIKKLAIKWNIVDYPNKRKIHKEPTPGLGGLAMFLGFLLGMLYLHPTNSQLVGIFIGAFIVIFTGLLDDKFDIRPILKLTGQLSAALVLILFGFIIENLTLPFFGMISLGWLSIPITILWIIGITNAINLIDGLDGLATGVSSIALFSILIVSLYDGQLLAAYFCVTLIGSNLGFLYHNFYPAKIYMGDTGSNFLGYMIAVISMVGLFKNVALLSFVIPVLILALPIFETLFSIVRRLINKQGVMEADNKHIHYQLLRTGLTHPQTVFVMYGFAILFGILAITFANGSVRLTIGVSIIALILIHILAELAGIVMGGKRPVIDRLMKLFKGY